ncbi:hypothetical protein INR49_006327 [Caranx melampygus]|nr:hypothetical protein INR49_006327 [Caranx melampygus]
MDMVLIQHICSDDDDDDDDDATEKVGDIRIKAEPDGDLEIQSYPILKKLSIKLTDCRSLRQHQSTNTGRKMVYCSECKKGFYKRSHLEAHRRIHQGLKPNECWQCGKTYPTLMSLVIHQQIHDRKEPYQCSYCDKTFSLKRDWKTHHRTHSGTKPFKCWFCGDGFDEQEELTEHLEAHKGEKCYHCKICDKIICGCLKPELLLWISFLGQYIDQLITVTTNWLDSVVVGLRDAAHDR